MLFSKTFSVVLHTQVCTLGSRKREWGGRKLAARRAGWGKLEAAGPPQALLSGGPILSQQPEEKVSLNGGKHAYGRPDAGRGPWGKVYSLD